MSDETRTDADAIIEVAQNALEPKPVDPNVPNVVIETDGTRAVILDLDKWRDDPKRKTGIYRPATVEAFIAYTKSHLGDGTTVWVHPTSGAIEAVIDDHLQSAPDWRGHRVRLALAPTPEWLYWAQHDGQMVGQTEFAEHIEGGLEEIVEPDSATMLEIAQTFHASVGSTFRSSVRLQSGEQRLQYDEEVKATAGTAGEMTVPAMILLGIAPFIAEEPYRIAARLRFRLRSGQLTLGYKLDRPDSIKRDALENVAERLGQHFPQVYVGEPPTE